MPLTCCRLWIILLIGVGLLGGCSRAVMGVNMGQPAPETPRVFYPVARVLDLFDMFSINISVGFGISAGAHLTHAISVDAGAKSYLVRMGQDRSPRQYVFGPGQEVGLHIGPYGVGFLNSASPFNTAYAYNYPVLKLPNEEIFQEHRDYWAIGAEAFAAIVGAEIEVHPIQIADFLAGWLYIDFLQDDWYGAHDPINRQPAE